jgi:hypothetical protein
VIELSGRTNGQPEFRGAERYGLDPFREWGRRILPPSRDGYVNIDGDSLSRRYGPRFGLDSNGDLMAIEKKENGAQVTTGEKLVYNWIDHGLRTGDYGSRWRGWHTLGVTYNMDWPMCPVCRQYIRTDTGLALRMFSEGVLSWDGKPINHDDLKRKILD